MIQIPRKKSGLQVAATRAISTGGAKRSTKNVPESFFYTAKAGRSADTPNKPVKTNGKVVSSLFHSISTARGEWAEENLDADDYEAAFGEVSEDGGKVVTSISISTSTKGILQREAGKTGKTMSELIEQAVLDTYK